MTKAREPWYWDRNWNSVRRGSRLVAMNWDGGAAVVRLFDEGSPATVEAFLAALPIELPFVHVAWSGEMVMAAAPIALGVKLEENRTRLVRPGDLAFDPKYDEITVTYGTAEARLPSGENTLTVFGEIVSGLEDFVRWGAGRRFEGVGSLRFEDREQALAGFPGNEGA